MNIAYIDIDAIFWKAFNNLRLFNTESFIKKMNDEAEIEKFFVFADFSTKEYLKPIEQKLIELSSKYNIEIIDGYSEIEGRNLTDITLINHLYQSFIQQSNPNENTYTIATVSAKYFSTINFIQKFSSNKINLFISNDLPYIEKLKTTYNIIDVIDLDSNKKNTFDKITIKEIIKTVKWAEKAERYFTVKNVIENCKNISNISNDKTEFMIHALISQGYLEKKLLRYENDNKEYKILVVGEEEKLNKFLTSLEV